LHGRQANPEADPGDPCDRPASDPDRPQPPESAEACGEQDMRGRLDVSSENDEGRDDREQENGRATWTI
jgi:hypothetical protein